MVHEALEQIADVQELGSALVDVARQSIDVVGVHLCPFTSGAVNIEAATMWHEQHASSYMRKLTVAFMPAQNHEFSRNGLTALEHLFHDANGVIDLNAAWSDRLERTHSYNEYWRPCQIERQLFAPLVGRGKPLGFLAVARTRRQRPFRENELRGMRELRAAALSALIRLDRQSPAPPEELAVALESLPFACGLFDTSGRLLWMSRAARRFCSIQTLKLGASRLVLSTAALSRWSRAAQNLCASGLASARIDDLWVTRTGGMERTIVLVIADDRVPTSLELVARARVEWALTARQTEVAQLLLDGRSNKEIAALLSCGVRTVDAHVSSILRKSNCGSRAEVIARIVGVGR